jgi:uncharacterized protein YdaU (DUF1376 family)
MSEAKRKPPAFQLYAGDLLSDSLVQQMTLEEFGAHMKLLCHAWLEEGIPADPDRLARLLAVERKRFEKLWAIVGEAWEPGSGYCAGKLVNARMERERFKLESFKRSRSEAGKKGAAARWG